jgi:hypothetical protein
VLRLLEEADQEIARVEGVMPAVDGACALAADQGMPSRPW